MAANDRAYHQDRTSSCRQLCYDGFRSATRMLATSERFMGALQSTPDADIGAAQSLSRLSGVLFDKNRAIFASLVSILILVLLHL
jgi:hypothetical protein